MYESFPCNKSKFLSRAFWLCSAACAIGIMLVSTAAHSAATIVADATIVEPALPPPLADAIDKATDALPRQRGLNADQRKQAEGLLHDAASDDDKASEDASKVRAYTDAAAKATDLARPPAPPSQSAGQALADWSAKLPQDASNDQLTDLLERERNQLSAAKDALRGIEDTLQKQTDRPDALRDELTAVHAQRDDTAATPVPPAPAADAPAALAEAQGLRAAAAQRLTRAHLTALETEQRTYDVRLRALFEQRSERRHDIDEHGQRVHLLENMLLDRFNNVVGDLVAKFTQERDAFVQKKAEPVISDAAQTNLDLGNDLVATLSRISTLRDEVNAYTTERSETAQALKSTQARIDLGGVSEEVGALLLTERRKLKPLGTLQRELAGLRSELAQTKLDVLNLRDEQDGLENLDGAIAKTLTQAGQLPVLAGSLHDDLQRLLNERRDVLPRLISAKTRRTQMLNDAEQQLTGLVASTQSLSDLLDAHLLGTPSDPPINFAWFGTLGHALVDVTHSIYRKGFGGFAGVRQGGVLSPLLALLMLGAAVLVRRRVPVEFERMAAPMRRIRTDGYHFTLLALALSIIAAAPIALFWWLLGRMLAHSAQSDTIVAALGSAVTAIAPAWFALAFLAWLNADNGLAHLHFRWPRARRIALRRVVPWLVVAFIVPLFVYAWLHQNAGNDIDSTIVRAMLILSPLGLALIAWRLLRAGGVWAARGSTLDNEPLRSRQIARVVVSGYFVVIAALAIAGYFFTAITLAGHILISLEAILAISVLHGLATRWLVLGERRLALKRAEERHMAQYDERNEPAHGEAQPDIEVEEVTVADLGAQTRRVLHLAIWVLLGFALLVVWSDIAPALSFLDKITVWKSTYADDSGKQIAFDVTVRSVLESALLLAMTFIATRNLPGLLEIGVLRRIKIDAASRYAITSIVRYLIVLIGTLVSIGLLGVQWSNLQWLAAGLTVGLGFGLQEIFANFVSGLIVLFERPYRVGDLVTIGGVEGTVARIRTRATTIIDADNKEVIVPNKSFITDQLVNWTLSDSVTRVVIKVGIAYRNDPREAQKLLLGIAAAHELVLSDPRPLCWMMAFGDSTLDFELRFFVAEIKQRNIVRTELQMRITEVFRDHDIELAFPQRDVWFRNPLQTNAAASASTAPPDQSGASADAINASNRV